jgi:hypothetical protein
MPQGSKRSENWEFYDQTFDGIWDGQYLRDGLGQLTDGRGGPINFKDDFYGPERGRLMESFRASFDEHSSNGTREKTRMNDHHHHHHHYNDQLFPCSREGMGWMEE